MLKLKYLEKEQFNKYMIKQEKMSHYMQSQAWGEFSKVYYNLTPYYLGLVNEKEEIVAATLLLEKKLKLNYTSFYIPYGFVADYKKNEIVNEMTIQLIEFIKNKKGLYFKINPNIIKDDTIKNKLKSLGYKASKENNSQNAYTIDLSKDINNNIDKKAKENIELTESIITETTIGNKEDLKNIYNEKYNKDYYDTLYDICNGNKNSKAEVLIIKINVIKTINEYEKKLKKINNQISIIPIDHLTKSSKDKLTELTNIKKNLLEIINEYKDIRKKHGNEVAVMNAFIIKYGNKAYLHSLSKNTIIDKEEIEDRAYYEIVKYYKNDNIKEIIQNEDDNNKILFGGEQIEYLDKMEYIIKPLTYFVLKKIIRII